MLLFDVRGRSHLWGACGFRWMHTPAHRDHPWNELADVIAGTIMAGRGPLDNLPDFGGGVRLGDVDFTFAGYVNSGKIRTPASFFYAGSLHRPAQTRPFEERQAFEADLSAFLEDCSGSPCLIGMDANGRVPGHADGITGDLLCGDPDHSGVQLVQTIGTFGCWLPSTFSECHHGPMETWTHPGGKRSRIDFPVVSRHFCPYNVCTWAATEIDTLNCNDDHDAVGFHVTLRQACRGDKPPQLDRKCQYDPRKLRDPAVVQRIERWIDCFGLRYVPWEIDVNLHAQIIQDALLAILCREAPVDERGPVSSYVPMDAWRVREARQIFKKRTRYRKQHGFADTIRLYFGRWASTAEPAGGVWPVTKDVLLYEVMAAAVKISTWFIKKRIRECKIELLENIASQVGVTSPANIFRRLKEMRLGARQPKLWKSSLPNLRNQTGELVSGRLQLDRAWLEYFGDMEMGAIVNTADFVSQVAQSSVHGGRLCP